MDAKTFATKTSMTYVHNLVSSVNWDGSDHARVWLRNGYGLAFAMDDADAATVSVIHFTEPFNPDWTTEPAWGTVEPAQVRTGMEVHHAANWIAELYELPRVQPLATPNR